VVSLSKNGNIEDWCKKLKKKCNPGVKGCIISNCEFTKLNLSDNKNDRKVKIRSDNPLIDSKYIVIIS